MHRPLLAALAVSFAIAPAALAGPAAPSVPGEIAVPSGHKPFLVGHATGVQIYACDGARAEIPYTADYVFFKATG